MPATRTVPSLRRQRRHNAPDRAFVQIKGKRHYLGRYGSPEAQEAYDRLVAEWLSGGRRLPVPPDELTVVELVERFAEHIEARHDERELSNYRSALRIVRQLYGSTPAAEFGPKRLRVVRQQFIAKGWAHTHINKQAARVRQMFRWGSAHELVPVDVHQRLATLEALRRGEAQREGRKVKPVPAGAIRAIWPHLSRQVRGLVLVHRLTGARADELVRIRATDLDVSGDVWSATLDDHKTAHHGKTRTLYFGPRAQRVLRVFMVPGRDVKRPLFSPRDAEAERYATASTHRRTAPSPRKTERVIGDAYTTASYRRAIYYACDAAWPPPAEWKRARVPARGRKAGSTRWETDDEWRSRIGDETWGKLKRWRGEHRWHPHQLRHSTATMVRREFGVEAAQVILGHSNIKTTEIYAAADADKARQVMGKVG